MNLVSIYRDDVFRYSLSECSCDPSKTPSMIESFFEHLSEQTLRREDQNVVLPDDIQSFDGASDTLVVGWKEQDQHYATETSPAATKEIEFHDVAR